MSSLVQQKISEARQLLGEAQNEEVEGTSLTEQIRSLTDRAESLLRSAREKRVIANSQLQAAETLGDGTVVAATPEKTKGGARKGQAKKGGKKAAATTTTVATAAPAAPVVSKTKKEGKSKTASAAPTAKTARVSSTEDKAPPLHERLKIVVGQDDVTIADAIERLRAKNWLPESEDMKAYISLVFSTHIKDLFDRVSRGVYRVKKGAVAAPAGSKSKKPVTAQKTNGAQNPLNGTGLEELGTNVLDNPFTVSA